jgi:formylglycine-generating enzyme required for sulfatase activity
MARLKFMIILSAAMLLSGTRVFAQQETQRRDLQDAGVCARCHVTSSLEWGISRHATVNRARNNRLPNCTGCHGESRGHVIDEQNSVKPDRMPQGDEIANLCLECHRRGCRQNPDRNDCQTCHHVHALVNPSLDAAAVQTRAQQLAQRRQTYETNLAQGQRLVETQQWQAAASAFTAALEVNPTSELAKSSLKMVQRRLHPGLPGFKTVGSEFDPASGLPRRILLESLGIEMVLVPAGSFEMGSDQHADSRPAHEAQVNAFYLAATEMTQAQWTALMSNNPSFYQGEKFPQAAKFPVEQVSWEDCRLMLTEINKRVSGGGFRLPTESEWEYAARAGGSAAVYPPQMLRMAWLRENSKLPDPAPGPAAPPSTRPGGGRGGLQDVEAAKLAAPNSYAPHPVGTSQPNRWGLYDMQGNVSEWCSSLAMPYPYTDSDGRESLDASGNRVVRGANFVDPMTSTDPTLRHSDRPTRKLRWTGVRLAFTPPDPQPVAAP